MGLRAEVSIGPGAVFSEDVLKVEVLGPKEDHLTIIDVPGIFRTTVQGTTKEDMATVKRLVENYIRDERTIILAVLPSNVDIAATEILELAEMYDKNGERTLGVLTKADLVLDEDMQAEICRLVTGKKRPLTLGYYLVRTRLPNGGSAKPLELDQLFQQPQYCHLPPERLGIAPLKEQLGSLWIEISQRDSPKLLRDVTEKIKKSKRELDSLGPPRQDEREQRAFLSQIAGKFQDRARAALAADYNADPVFAQDNNLRLITHIVNITDVFSADFHERAHSLHFEDIKSTPVLAEETSRSSDSGDESEAELDQPTSSILRTLLREARVDNTTPDEHAELGDIIILPGKIKLPRGDVSTWISDVYLRSRGVTLGTFNSHMISQAFAEQSQKWGFMTQLYMSRVIVATHRFISAALRSVCPDEQTHSRLWLAILDCLVKRYQIAIDQANLLVKVEQHKQPYTLNRQFSVVLSKARGHRMADLLAAKARNDTKQYGNVQRMISLTDVEEFVQAKDNITDLQETIHDILYSYYTLALDRFIDNVFQLAVDHYLLQGPSSPLKVFTQDWIIDLEPPELEQIAGESKATKKRRAKLTRKIEDFSRGLKILRG